MTLKYSLLKERNFFLNEYSLVPLRKSDIQKIKNWRNEQLDVLRQKTILTKTDQLNYYETIIKKSFHENKPNIILFSFLMNKKCIGYGGLVHIDWDLKKAEVSFINDTLRSQSKTSYKKDFSTFLKIIFKIAFVNLSLNKLTTETFDIRPFTIKILEDLGFTKEGHQKNHVLINNELHDSLLHAKFNNSYSKR